MSNPSEGVETLLDTPEADQHEEPITETKGEDENAAESSVKQGYHYKLRTNLT